MRKLWQVMMGVSFILMMVMMCAIDTSNMAFQMFVISAVMLSISGFFAGAYR